jgi:hypothetical protein
LREFQNFEDKKTLSSSLFNYSLYVTSSNPEEKSVNVLSQDLYIDDDLDILQKLYSESQETTFLCLSKLKSRLIKWKEPSSVDILQSKNDKEKEYLQRTIVMMELK